MKYIYEYILDNDVYPDDAIKFESAWEPGENNDYIAQEAAENLFDSDPDPEYFPAILEIYSDSESIGSFKITIDFEPNFTAELIY